MDQLLNLQQKKNWVGASTCLPHLLAVIRGLTGNERMRKINKRLLPLSSGDASEPLT